MIKAEKIILPVLKHFVLLQRSKSSYGVKTVGKSVGFFYTYLLNVKPMACWCAVAVMPARIRNLILNDADKPFLLNVLKTSYNEHTASKDGGRDRNQKSPCLNSLGAQIHRIKHHPKHLFGTPCLLRRELQYQGATRHAGRQRDGSVGNVNEFIVCHQDDGARLHRRLAL